MYKCDHCLLETPERKAIFDTIKGQKKVFCCHGCRGVYRLINDEGLEEFYQRRESLWTPGPPQDISLETSAFSETLREVGNEMEIDIVLDGIRCASCIWLIEKILLRTEGVSSAKVNYATHKARIRWNPQKIDIREILIRIKSVGYTPKPFIAEVHEEQLKVAQRDLLMRFGTAAFFSMQLMLYSVAMYAGYFQGIGESTKIFFQIIALLLTTPVLFYSGMPFISGTVRGLRNLTFNMDVLIFTGAGSAYLYSIYQIFAGGEVYFDTSAMIITLILLGRYIEAGAKGRASSLIARLLALNPKEAKKVVRSQKSEVESRAEEDLRKGRTIDVRIDTVPVSSIQRGDLIQINPGERIPLDGIVNQGSSEVDESMLTGESKPVSKKAGSEVFCGTQNLYGNIVFEVKRTGNDTVLSQIIRTVEDAQARRAPVQALADRVVGYFVPGVLFLSFMTGMIWFIYGRSVTDSIMNAVSVLVIACPCALGLATPLAILLGTSRGASRGILIKGGDIIERAKDIDTVVLDKTGTITEGKPELALYYGIGISDTDALSLVSSLERLSEHSIAKAIIQYSGNIATYKVAEFAAHPGKGIRGDVDGKTVLVGSRRYIEKEGIFRDIDDTLAPEMLSMIETEETSGSTVIFLSYDEKLAGIFVISDKVREEAGEAVAMMQRMGHDVNMITGDNRNTALTVAGRVNLDNLMVMAEKSPLEKAEAVRKMQEEGGRVVMVGDGINDAPALVQAHVGIAMGRATDIALESADIVFMREDLRLVSDALRLSKRTYSVIKQNLFWAFAYNMLALPLAVAGMLHPIIAAVSMTLSSLSVVGNSMRLKRG
jgi:Cu2+-exporting ATPase